jgi:acyl dehydratase
MNAPAPVLFDDVVVGDVLPTLSVDVTPTTVVLGALASRDWRPMHHDYKFATERNGVADVFLNTPNQAAWFERYVTDWSGPRARLGRMTFRMKTSVFPGDRMELAGTVTGVDTDALGQGWATVDVTLTATATDGRDPAPRLATTCTVRVALPSSPTDNPWSRRGTAWAP